MTYGFTGQWLLGLSSSGDEDTGLFGRNTGKKKASLLAAERSAHDPLNLYMCTALAGSFAPFMQRYQGRLDDWERHNISRSGPMSRTNIRHQIWMLIWPCEQQYLVLSTYQIGGMEMEARALEKLPKPLKATLKQQA